MFSSCHCDQFSFYMELIFLRSRNFLQFHFSTARLFIFISLRCDESQHTAQLPEQNLTSVNEIMKKIYFNIQCSLFVTKKLWIEQHSPELMCLKHRQPPSTKYNSQIISLAPQILFFWLKTLPSKESLFPHVTAINFNFHANFIFVLKWKIVFSIVCFGSTKRHANEFTSLKNFPWKSIFLWST
jgi:hypothetical protein